MIILIADDHALFRETLTIYIERSVPGAIVQAVPNLEDIRRKLDQAEGHYDLVLLDWHMPGVSGLKDIRKLMDDFPRTKFAVMSGVIEQRDVREAIQLGIHGYFPKTLTAAMVGDGIQKIINGERFLPMLPDGRPFPSSYADPAPLANEEAAHALNLTQRENQVLQKLAEGLTNAEIGNDLGIKIVTVKLHVRNCYRKLGVRNRTEAVGRLRKLGMIA